MRLTRFKEVFFKIMINFYVISLILYGFLILKEYFMMNLYFDDFESCVCIKILFWY